MKTKPAATLFLLAVLYGFLSRFAGDVLHTGMFQAPLVVLPLAVAACLAFNVFYSLRPVESGKRTAVWLITLYVGYVLAGVTHNILVPDLAYGIDARTVLMSILVLALVGFGIGLVTPLVFVQKRRSRLASRV